MAFDDLRILIFSINTLRTPPDISLPIHTPFIFDQKVQLRMTTFSVAVQYAKHHYPRPDLIAIASSPVEKVQPSIKTLLHDSGSQPSLFRL